MTDTQQKMDVCQSSNADCARLFSARVRRTDGLCYAALPVNAVECPRREHRRWCSRFVQVIREELPPEKYIEVEKSIRADPTKVESFRIYPAVIYPRDLLPHHPHGRTHSSTPTNCSGLVSSFFTASKIATAAFVWIWRFIHPCEFGADFIDAGI